MRIWTLKLTLLAAIAAVVLLTGRASLAQAVPCNVPAFSPDFSANQGCLQLTGNYNNTGNTTPNINSPYPQFLGNGVSEVLRLTPDAQDWAGGAFFTAQQPVAPGFSTTFTFRITASGTPADGFAFVIQNDSRGDAALAYRACGMGFGQDTYYPNGGFCSTDTPPGITNSVAVSFKTYNDGYPNYFPNTANSVSIMSGGTGNNCVNFSCAIAVNNFLPNGITLYDGNIHTVTVSYTLTPTQSSSPYCFSEGNVAEPCLDVILDGQDLFNGGVYFDLTTLGLTSNTSAWLGFTAGTGGLSESHDIISWTFAPVSASEAQPVPTLTGSPTTVYNFNGGYAPDTGGYDYTIQGTNPSQSAQTFDAVTTAIPTPLATCNAIIGPSGSPFAGAQCFTYQFGATPNSMTDSPVMFELTCPSEQHATCGTAALQNFIAQLGTDFTFAIGENSPLNLVNSNPNITPFGPLQAAGANPYVGFLKGEGPDPLHPCTPYPSDDPRNQSMFSNQIISFNLVDPGSKPVVASSGGTASCWVVTYLTPGEVPTVSITSPANNSNFTQNEQGLSTTATYTCTTVYNGASLPTAGTYPADNPTGPYLTGTCSASDNPGGSVASGAYVDTSILGTHTLTATVLDSATNTASQSITYTVQGTQAIILSGVPAGPLPYLSTFTVMASGGSSGSPLQFGNSGSCSIISTTATTATYQINSGIGACTVTVNQSGGNNYQAAQQVTGMVNAAPANQAPLTLMSSPLTYNQTENLSVTGGSSNGIVTYNLITGPCTLVANQLTANSGTGSCTVTATMAGGSNYNPVTSAPANTVTLGLANQTPLTLHSTPLTYNQTEALSVTGGSTNGIVTYNLITGPCSLAGAQLTANSGTGSCSVTATMAGNSNYNSVTSTPANTVSLGLATQSILLSVPASAVYGSNFIVGASASSGLPVTVMASGGCTNVGTTFTMTSGTVACSVIASQAGSGNYSMALTVTKGVTATLATPVITWPTPAPIVSGTPLSGTQLDATASTTGTFAYTPAAGTVLGVGTPTLSVTFTPSAPANFASAMKSVTLTVFAPTVTMGISTQTQTYQQWTNFVIGPIFTGSRIPTGSVTLYDNGAPVVTLPLGGNGLAYYTANPFNVGPNVMTASYSGDSHFAAGVASPVTITVKPAPVNFQASCWGGTPWTVLYQCTVNVSASTTTIPGGNITYSLDGATPTTVALSGGNAAFTVPTVPAMGNHTLTINYAAQGNFAAGTTITKTFTTLQGQTQLLVYPSNYNPAAGSSITLAGTATTPSSGIPPGSITLYDGAVAIGTAPITAGTGAVTYTVTNIARGSHTYSAKYAGSTNYAAATSASSVVTAH